MARRRSIALALMLLLLLVVDGSMERESKEVREVLEENGIPPGLFPLQLISHYKYEEHDKTLRLNLTMSCYANFEDTMLWYDRSIEGKVDHGKMYDISGLQTKRYVIWLPVTGLHREGSGDEEDNVYLEVGPLSYKLKASTLEEPPVCTPSKLDDTFHFVN